MTVLMAHTERRFVRVSSITFVNGVLSERVYRPSIDAESSIRERDMRVEDLMDVNSVVRRFFFLDFRFNGYIQILA